MYSFKKNKKGISEVLSFILITFLVASISLISYNFADTYLKNRISKIDLENMKTHLKKLDYKLKEIENIPRSAFSYDISFNTGGIEILDDKITFYSKNPYHGGQITCLDSICTQSQGDLEVIWINLTQPYLFTQNLTLNPNTYRLYFENTNNNNLSVNLK